MVCDFLIFFIKKKMHPIFYRQFSFNFPLTNYTKYHEELKSPYLTRNSKLSHKSFPNYTVDAHQINPLSDTFYDTYYHLFFWVISAKLAFFANILKGQVKL